MGLGDIIDNGEEESEEKEQNDSSGSSESGGLSGLIDSHTDKNTPSGKGDRSDSGGGDDSSGGGYNNVSTTEVEEDIAPPRPKDKNERSLANEALADYKECPSCGEPGPKATGNEGEPLWYWKCSNKDCTTITFISSEHRSYYRQPHEEDEEDVGGTFLSDEDELPDEYSDFLEDVEL